LDVGIWAWNRPFGIWLREFQCLDGDGIQAWKVDAIPSGIGPVSALPRNFPRFLARKGSETASSYRFEPGKTEAGGSSTSRLRGLEPADGGSSGEAASPSPLPRLFLPHPFASPALVARDLVGAAIPSTGLLETLDRWGEWRPTADGGNGNGCGRGTTATSLDLPKPSSQWLCFSL
jgi:hypothetical protein